MVLRRIRGWPNGWRPWLRSRAGQCPTWCARRSPRWSRRGSGTSGSSSFSRTTWRDTSGCSRCCGTISDDAHRPGRPGRHRRAGPGGGRPGRPRPDGCHRRERPGRSRPDRRRPDPGENRPARRRTHPRTPPARNPSGSDPAAPATPAGQAGAGERAADRAAALLSALVRHRPLAHGNERAAVLATVTFLAVNGWQAELARLRSRRRWWPTWPPGGGPPAMCRRGCRPGSRATPPHLASRTPRLRHRPRRHR